MIENYLVVRFEHGDCEWHAEHVWESHKRMVPSTKGKAIAGPMPIQDAINLTELANGQRAIENQTQPQT
jgi:hypothetical protein